MARNSARLSLQPKLRNPTDKTQPGWVLEVRTRLGKDPVCERTMLTLFSRWALRMHPASESKRESLRPHFYYSVWGSSVRDGTPHCFMPCRTQLPELAWKAKNLPEDTQVLSTSQEINKSYFPMSAHVLNHDCHCVQQPRSTRQKSRHSQ